MSSCLLVLPAPVTLITPLIALVAMSLIPLLPSFPSFPSFPSSRSPSHPSRPSSPSSLSIQMGLNRVPVRYSAPHTLPHRPHLPRLLDFLRFLHVLQVRWSAETLNYMAMDLFFKTAPVHFLAKSNNRSSIMPTPKGPLDTSKLLRLTGFPSKSYFQTASWLL